MATAAEISEYDTEELERQLGETRRELFNLRFQLATGQLDNFSRINHIRKDVARMMTELRIREKLSSWPVASWNRRLKSSRRVSPSWRSSSSVSYSEISAAVAIRPAPPVCRGYPAGSRTGP